MSFFEKFGRSALELKSVRCLVTTGMLIALDLVLKLVSVKLSDNLKITFAYLALATIGMLFGPSVGFLAGIITDIVGFLLKPDGGFSPLFTIVEAVGAMIYGIFLYEIKPVILKGDKRKIIKTDTISAVRVILSKVTVVIVCNLVMTPVAMVLSGYMTWESVAAGYPVRLVKNAVQCPVDCILMLLVLFPVLAAYRKIFPEDVSAGSETYKKRMPIYFLCLTLIIFFIRFVIYLFEIFEKMGNGG